MEADAANSWRSEQRMYNRDSIGLLVAGEDFVVAELVFNAWPADEMVPLEAKLFRLQSSSSPQQPQGGGQWELIRVKSRGGAGAATFHDVPGWMTHTVVPFGSYLCWADYCRGVLLCDVFQPAPDLQYYKLPDAVPVGDPDIEFTGCPEASRTVCVTKEETMKFVYVDDSGNGTSRCPNCTCPSCTRARFSITVWTFSHGVMEWVQDCSIGADELWAMDGYDHDKLPRYVPQFALVSMDDLHILYFVLLDENTFFAEKGWIVTLDMESKTILGYDDIKDFPSNNVHLLQLRILS